mmetsp:Transcript_76515/g.169046  ORF Transcript_76515/g.169046 Transcript_76515/m.169046 type:complete len:275 (-) Transcript_76515:312-1136(-)
MAEKDLKHLAFVQSGSTVAIAHAEKAYSTLRTYTPAFASAQLLKAEEQLSAAAAPLLTKAQDQAAQLLAFADNKVDVLLNGMDGALARGKEALGQVRTLHESNMEAFRSASASYYTLMGETADYVMSTLHVKEVKEASMARVTAARETLAQALSRAKELGTDPDVAVAAAWDAWSGFASLAPVAKVLETAEPATKASVSAFTKLHDALVAAPVYKSLLARTAGMFSYAAGTTPYKLGAQYFWPVVQPIADPAISKVSQSKVATSFVGYWTPVSA